MLAHGSRTVLVVDDDAEDLIRLAHSVPRPYAAIPCVSAAHAARATAALAATPLAAIIDVALGGGPDGIEVLRGFRSRWSGLPALVITGGISLLSETFSRLTQLGQPFWFWPKQDAPQRIPLFLELAELAMVLDLPDASDLAEVVHQEALARHLTSAQRDVLALIVRGDSLQEMAARLGIRTATVKTHITDVLAKTPVPRCHALRSELLARANARRVRRSPPPPE